MPNVNTWLVKEQEKDLRPALLNYMIRMRAFKLNDSVTFIGILEFTKKEDQEEMKMECDEGAQGF